MLDSFSQAATVLSHENGDVGEMAHYNSIVFAGIARDKPVIRP